MFDNSSVYVLTIENVILRLEIDKATQNAICSTFSSSVESLVCGKTGHAFSANYKPEDDEYLTIEGFQLMDEIKDAIRNPLGVTAYGKDPDIRDDGEEDFTGYPDIKAIFVGERIQDDETEKFNVAFQRYRREQNLVALPFRLFWSNDSFLQDKRFGIGITYMIDCYYTGEELRFSSFFFARQIFDLSGYYRSATDPEVASFTENPHLTFESADGFKGMANSYVRRKIAMINDSGVLEKYTAIQIKSLAKSVGLDITVRDKKVVVPADKEDALLVVGFLDEEAYRGPFSKNLLLANSKRVVKRNG